MMYWEERIINGVLCYRNHPDKEFTPYTAESLTQKVVDLTGRNRKLREKVEAKLEEAAKAMVKHYISADPDIPEDEHECCLKILREKLLEDSK